MSTRKIFKFWLLLDPIFRLSKDYKPFMKHKQDIYCFIDSVAADFESDFQLKEETVDRSQHAYLDQLYKIRHTMSYDQVREEIFAFLIGAFDTTGKALPAVLLLLAMNQKEQDKVAEELKTILVSENDEVDETSLNRMEYLDLAMKESLRMLPVALLLARHVQKDIKLCNFTC